MKHLLPLLAALVVASPLSADPRPPRKLRPQEIAISKNVEYARPDNRPLHLDLAVPPSERPLPLVVYIHGGGWRSGSKEKHLPARLLEYGYAVASINYRLTGVAPFPAQIHDCKAAIRFLRANAPQHNIDPDRIGVWGSSAGGHLAALLGTSANIRELEGDLGHPGVSSRVQAVINYCGPADLAALAHLPGIRPDKRDYANDALAALLGGHPADCLPLARLASPVTHVSRDAAPFFIVHGDRDPLVPFAQSKSLAAALRNANVPTTFLPLPGAGHNVSDALRKTPRAAQSILDFLDRHLLHAPTTRPAR